MDPKRKALRELTGAALRWAAAEFYADDHPEDPSGDWSAEMLEEELITAAQRLAVVVEKP